jgi:hypothetical protein
MSQTTDVSRWNRPANGDEGSALARRDTGGGRLPTRPRSRGLITLAVLLVVGCALCGALLVSRAGDKTAVLAIGKPVAKGEVVERGDLVTTNVAGVSGAVLATDIDEVVGKTAATDLVAQQIVTDSMVTSDPVPGEGEALVGLALDPTRVPTAGLVPGDTVRVVAVSDAKQGGSRDEADDPEVLAEAAEVYAVEGSATDGGVVLTVVVPEGDAARVAAYSTGGRVAVVETAAAPAEGE